MPVDTQPVGVDHASRVSLSQLAVGWAWDLEKSETAGSRCQLAPTMPVGTFVRRGTWKKFYPLKLDTPSDFLLVKWTHFSARQVPFHTKGTSPG
jgi:hypothetical protein